MKKILLATTAVVALSAGVAQAEINLDVGGFFKAYGGYANQDTANVRDFDIKRKSQLFFSGETTLDNGLTVGAHTELVGDIEDPFSATGGEVGTEETYMYFSGNWGRFNFGRENGAAYLLQVSAPGADADLDGQDIEFSFVNLGSNNVDQDYQQSGLNSDAQYSDKLTYLTPKFNGLQAGVSYSPTYESLQRDTQLAGMISNDDSGDLEDFMEAGLRYDGELSGVGIHAGAGYSTADQEVDDVGDDDYQEWNAGLKFDINSFGFGAAYNTDNGAQSADADTDTFTVGADYTYGAVKFGASYLNSEGETGAGDDELDRYMIGADYTYGPGMNFKGSVAQYSFDSAAGTTDNDATVVAIGTAVSF